MAITTVGTSPAHPFIIRQFLSYRLAVLPATAAVADAVSDHAGSPRLRHLAAPGNRCVRLARRVSAPIGCTPRRRGWSVGRDRASALLSRLRDRTAPRAAGFFALTLVALLGLLHITEYRVLIIGGGQFLQGRYLLPVVGLLGLAVGLIVAAIPRRARAPSARCGSTGLLAFQVDLAGHRSSRRTTCERPRRGWVIGATLAILAIVGLLIAGSRPVGVRDNRAASPSQDPDAPCSPSQRVREGPSSAAHQIDGVGIWGGSTTGVSHLTRPGAERGWTQHADFGAVSVPRTTGEYIARLARPGARRQTAASLRHGRC